MWVGVLYVAKLMKTVACVLQDVHDTNRLWALSPRFHRRLRQADWSLAVALGNCQNADGFHGPLDVV